MTDLPLARAYHWERTSPQEIFLTQPIGGVPRDWTWAQTMDESRRVANHLLSQNWPPGSHIVIFSKNCAWWIMAELAIWMSGHVTVPIYPSLTSQSAHQLFEHCDPIACFVGPLDSPDLSQQAIPPELYVIHFPNVARTGAINWDEIVKKTEPLPANPERRPDEIATIIYTSGTTGSPKGAMHHFLMFPYIAGAVAQVTGQRSHRALSYLPLAHIAERGLTETMALYYSWHLFFTEGITTFITDLKRAQPTVFFSVPRLYSKFQQNVFEKISRDKLAQLLKLPVIGTLVGKYILRQMGFDHVQFAASGSAALPLDLLTWFRSLGFPLAEGYGTTEIGITHTALNGECRPGYVGKTAPGVETRISETGEVLLRSPMNMVGYYKNPEDTNQVFTPDGFLRTGDLGQLSADGWLKITGRIKEQFKTAKGEYVTPAKIESLISSDPAVEHCLVLGTNLRAPCAIVVLTAAAARQAATEIGRQALENRFKDLLESVNSHVESHERLALIALLNAQWTIETGFITPTLKLRRTPLESAYNAFLPAWIERNERIVWHLT